MAAVNKAILVGNLGAKPDVRFTESGQCVCNFSMATNEKWKDRDGKEQERVEWHRIIAWGKLGEACGEHLDKGKQVYVEGRLQTRKWKDDAGTERWTTEVVAHQVQFLGTKGERRDEPPPPGDDAIPF